MKLNRRFFKIAAVVVLAGLLLMAVIGYGMLPRLVRNFLQSSPIPVEVGGIHRIFPVGVVIEELSVPDPESEGDFLLKIKKLHLRAPLWGLVFRPLPVRVAVDSPHLKVGSAHVTEAIDLMEVHPAMDWLYLPSQDMFGLSGPGGKLRLPPVAPLEIAVENGRIEVIEPDLREEAPLFIVDQLNVKTGMRQMVVDPTIRFDGRGRFVTETGKPIGRQEAAFRLKMMDQSMSGSILIRHEQLEDFHRLYEYAPSPILIQGGLTEFSIDFEVTGGTQLKFTARTLVQNLDMEGFVGEVNWGQIMAAVEDENRIYSWEVAVEGRLDDPAWNPHDTVLREVEFKMKEKAAANGLRIEEPLFFYADQYAEGEESSPLP